MSLPHLKVSMMSTFVFRQCRHKRTPFQSSSSLRSCSYFHRRQSANTNARGNEYLPKRTTVPFTFTKHNPMRITFRTLVTSSGGHDLKANDSQIITGVPLDSQSILGIEEQINAVQHEGKIGVLFSDSVPVIFSVDLLYVIKDIPGLSWIGTILLGTVLIRIIVGLPVAIIQQKLIGRLADLKPEFQNLATELKRETALAIKKFNWDEKTAKRQFTKSYKKHWRRLVEENNCHPMRILALSLVQLPVWVCFSSALRNVVYALPLPRTPEMLERWSQIYNESVPWTESLVVPDPVILPAVFLVTNLLNIQFGRRNRSKDIPETGLQKAIPWVLRGGIVLISYVATSVPSAVALYWASSSTIALTQNIFLSSGVGRSLFKLPLIPQASVKSGSIEPPWNSTDQQKQKSV